MRSPRVGTHERERTLEIFILASGSNSSSNTEQSQKSQEKVYHAETREYKIPLHLKPSSRAEIERETATRETVRRIDSRESFITSQHRERGVTDIPARREENCTSTII